MSIFFNKKLERNELVLYNDFKVIFMFQNGIVKKLHTNTAEVEIHRSAACGESCASCGLCAGQNAIVTVSNELGAAVGDSVTIDMANRKVLGAAFLVYIVPLIALIAGYFIGFAIFKSELPSVGLGFALMAVTFVIIILCDKKLKKRYTPRIVHIEEKNNV